MTQAMARYLALILLALPGTVRAGDVCREIDATQGWQRADYPAGMVGDVQVTGTWTASDGTHAPVGAPGHLEAEADRIEDSAALGALLFEITLGEASHRGSWALFKTMLDEAGAFRMDSSESGARLRFRINESDDGLSDNAGALTVCMHYLD
ncbi:hypothetical protein [Sagittula salina]|uniref:Uncharacterized protein n=1 Tax=Sagittula salina TaxID=2820268 RepID=A0A940S115_9RHOB|nr:hypothetical protein [Sagittula salina]MBP0483663.1 hypothetical protein [Sagittula salina]